MHKRGVNEVRVFDLFDPRADCHYDMNLPVPPDEHERYGTFVDIGSIEHVFDTRQPPGAAFANARSAVSSGTSPSWSAPEESSPSTTTTTLIPEWERPSRASSYWEIFSEK